MDCAGALTHNMPTCYSLKELLLSIGMVDLIPLLCSLKADDARRREVINRRRRKGVGLPERQGESGISTGSSHPKGNEMLKSEVGLSTRGGISESFNPRFATVPDIDCLSS